MAGAPPPRLLALPVIDIAAAAADEAAAAAAVRAACVGPGFFYVTNHGAEPLRGALFERTATLFDAPLAAKLAMRAAPPLFRGYTPLQEETLDPASQTEGDTKEGFYFGRDVPAGSAEAALPLHGPNAWPPEALAPGFRAAATAYFEAARALGFRLLRLLALALGLPAEHFHPSFARPMLFLRPLRYAPVASRPDAGLLGAGAHTDYGMLTLLATDGVPGLQIRQEGGWLGVPPLEGALIVNLGDLLERCGGLLRQQGGGRAAAAPHSPRASPLLTCAQPVADGQTGDSDQHCTGW